MDIKVDDVLGKLTAVINYPEMQKNADNLAALIDTRLKFVELVKENHELKIEVKRLREQLDSKDELRRAHDCFWKGEPGPEGDGPYCPKCWQVNGLQINMVLRPSTYHVCLECETLVQIPGIR
jgi:hypothetical protein